MNIAKIKIGNGGDAVDINDNGFINDNDILELNYDWC
jgi:hypothetical protein